MIDVVIPYRHDESKWAGNELRYCLRALEKNLKTDSRVFIIGDEIPDWLNQNSIIWITCSDLLLRNKDGNIITKLLTVVQESPIDKFLFLSDDQLFWKEMKIEDVKPYYIPLYPDKIRGRFQWRMKNTMDILKSRGKSWFNYESHIPVIYDRSKFVEVIETFPYEIDGEGITINTAYLNSVLRQHTVMPSDERAAFERPQDFDLKKDKFNVVKYVSYNDNGLSIGLKKAISEKFKEISKFEKYS